MKHHWSSEVVATVSHEYDHVAPFFLSFGRPLLNASKVKSVLQLLRSGPPDYLEWVFPVVKPSSPKTENICL